MNIDDEFDDEVKIIDEAFKVAEEFNRRRGKPSHRETLDKMIRELASSLLPSEKKVTKQEVKYLVNAYRLLKKVKEIRDERIK